MSKPSKTKKTQSPTKCDAKKRWGACIGAYDVIPVDVERDRCGVFFGSMDEALDGERT